MSVAIVPPPDMVGDADANATQVAKSSSETWMEPVHAPAVVWAVSVATFIAVVKVTTALLRQALEIVGDLAANQVEYHPYLSQRPLLDLMRERGIVLIAHSPLARGTLLNDPVLQQIAARRRLSVAQVALRWLVQQDRVVAIPGVQNIEQLRENLKVLDVTLTSDEMTAISALARGTRVVNPPHGPVWD